MSDENEVATEQETELPTDEQVEKATTPESGEENKA